MNILDDERDLYGKITQTDPDSPEAKSACDRLFEVGEAVKVDVGEMMLERQRVLYVGALRAARVLLDLAGEDAEVDEEVVAEYEEQIKSRVRRKGRLQLGSSRRNCQVVDGLL